jgi:hypothetical protein
VASHPEESHPDVESPASPIALESLQAEAESVYPDTLMAAHAALEERDAVNAALEAVVAARDAEVTQQALEISELKRLLASSRSGHTGSVRASTDVKRSTKPSFAFAPTLE